MKKQELLEKNNIEMWKQETIDSFRQTLLEWYDKHKRDLPWRQTSNPYFIWVSEVMLQQTQVDTVIPYYNRFIETLPTINDLAEASEETILKLWEGLGYYSRVRNMKVAANQIVENYQGIFPTDKKEVLKLKGIGPYTSGAILSIAFNKIEPAVDGNVMRVLSRLFEIDLDIGKASNRKVFEEMIRHLIDPNRPGDFNQALMDLGATICTPKNYFPEKSPVREFNASYVNETWEHYPVKKSKKKAREETYLTVAIKNSKGAYLFKKRPKKGVLAGMWTFIMIDKTDIKGKWKSFEKKKAVVTAEEIENYLLEEYGLSVKVKNQSKSSLTHVFSHLKWHLTIHEAELTKENSAIENTEWIHPEEFERITFPMPTQKVWEKLNTITLF